MWMLWRCHIFLSTHGSWHFDCVRAFVKQCCDCDCFRLDLFQIKMILHLLGCTVYLSSSALLLTWYFHVWLAFAVLEDFVAILNSLNGLFHYSLVPLLLMVLTFDISSTARFYWFTALLWNFHLFFGSYLRHWKDTEVRTHDESSFIMRSSNHTKKSSMVHNLPEYFTAFEIALDWSTIILWWT